MFTKLSAADLLYVGKGFAFSTTLLSTVESHYNTPCYTADFCITLLLLGSRLFKHEIIRNSVVNYEFSENLLLKQYCWVLHRIQHYFSYTMFETIQKVICDQLDKPQGQHQH